MSSNRYGRRRRHQPNNGNHGHNKVNATKPAHAKQYVINYDRFDATVVMVDENGFVSRSIMNSWEVDGYVNRLHEEGYTNAEYVPAIEDEIAATQKHLDFLREQLERAKQCPFDISAEDAKEHGLAYKPDVECV